MQRLKQRADFLAAAAGGKAHAAGFVLQTRRREDEGPPRIGFTVSKKVGNAVERNRVRRRLKEMVRLARTPIAAGHDYVLIGRRAALTLPFTRLAQDFTVALGKVEGAGAQGTRVQRGGSTRPPPASGETNSP